MPKDKSLGADGQPKFFFTEEKAKAFIERKSLTDTHTAQQGGGRWLIVPKEDSHD